MTKNITSLIGSITYKDHLICIKSNNNPKNPRDKDTNVSTMIIIHKDRNNVKLGDNHNYNFDNLNDLEKAIMIDNPNCMMRPLHIIDNKIHMGYIRESNLVGFIYISHAKALKVLNKKRISYNSFKQLETYFIQEIRDYNFYLNGEVYGFNIYSLDENIHNEWKEIDPPPYGFYGDDHEESGLLNEARNIINNFK